MTMEQLRLPRIMTESAVTIALAALLSFIKLFRMPQGGEVSLVMVPLIIFAFYRGAAAGFLAGAGFGCIHFLQSLYAVHPLQFFLDYPCAYGAAGIAGFFRGRPCTAAIAALSVLSVMALRFLLHSLSGALFVRFFLPSFKGNAWAYSALYNASYIIPDTIIAFVVISLVMPRLRNVFCQGG